MPVLQNVTPAPDPNVPHSIVNLPAGATSEPAISITEKIIGAAVTLTPNAMSYATNQDPFLLAWGGVLNVFLDKLKREKWFPETITPYVMIILGLGLGYLLYVVLNNSTDITTGLGKGAWIVTQTHTNWIGGKRLGAFSSTTADERFRKADFARFD